MERDAAMQVVEDAMSQGQYADSTADFEARLIACKREIEACLSGLLPE